MTSSRRLPPNLDIDMSAVFGGNPQAGADGVVTVAVPTSAPVVSQLAAPSSGDQLTANDIPVAPDAAHLVAPRARPAVADSPEAEPAPTDASQPPQRNAELAFRVESYLSKCEFTSPRGFGRSRG